MKGCPCDGRADDACRRGRVGWFPASCWWEPATLYNLDSSLVDLTDADALESWYKHDLPRLINGSFTIGRIGYGELASWQPALDKIRAGEKVTPYQPRCRQDAADCALNDFSGNAMGPSPAAGSCGIPVAIGFFGTGAAPAPRVAPADLAQIARDQMHIPDPQVDRNPKVTALGEATLVGLPTWFWVTNPASVGGALGSRTIRAQLGAVWAEVVAWTGSGNTGGALAPLQRGTRVEVPVAESQTVVTGAR